MRIVRLPRRRVRAPVVWRDVVSSNPAVRLRRPFADRVQRRSHRRCAAPVLGPLEGSRWAAHSFHRTPPDPTVGNDDIERRGGIDVLRSRPRTISLAAPRLPPTVPVASQMEFCSAGPSVLEESLPAPCMRIVSYSNNACGAFMRWPHAPMGKASRCSVHCFGRVTRDAPPSRNILSQATTCRCTPSRYTRRRAYEEAVGVSPCTLRRVPLESPHGAPTPPTPHPHPPTHTHTPRSSVGDQWHDGHQQPARVH